MSEPTSPPPPPSSAPPPPPPPSSPPPSSGGGASQNRGVMIALSYLWILFLVPLLLEKEDKEVQWHAKHGLVLSVAELILWVVLSIVSNVIPFLGCTVLPLIWVVILIVRIVCIVKGINGERFTIPGVSEYADRIQF